MLSVSKRSFQFTTYLIFHLKLGIVENHGWVLEVLVSTITPHSDVPKLMKEVYEKRMINNQSDRSVMSMVIVKDQTAYFGVDDARHASQKHHHDAHWLTQPRNGRIDVGVAHSHSPSILPWCSPGRKTPGPALVWSLGTPSTHVDLGSFSAPFDPPMHISVASLATPCAAPTTRVQLAPVRLVLPLIV